MEKLILLGILTAVFFIIFILMLDLIGFFYREKKRFFQGRGRMEYHAYLENKQKKCRHPQKKNFYLYLWIHLLSQEGKEEKAKALIPFLKNDPFLGIKK